LSRHIPHHLAIVMDGNGRWASRRFLPRVAGHKVGVDVLRACVRRCAELGVKVLTVFAFSS
jgi:undecaprenyl diphosphate synthase